jgi:hypothetical protein
MIFETTFKLVRGRWHRLGKRVIATEDLREHIARESADTGRAE